MLSNAGHMFFVFKDYAMHHSLLLQLFANQVYGLSTALSSIKFELLPCHIRVC